MNIVPISDKTPACYGVMCPEHKQCARYHLVDNAPHGQQFIATCEHGRERPLFVQHRPEEVAA